MISALLASHEWPDSLDRSSIAVFLLFVVVGPALGYFFLVADVRAYMRALRGALVVVRQYFPETPAWARLETPACLRVLGLPLGCTEAEVKRAYRRQAELLHPDRGGDPKRFTRLQEHFEAALLHARENPPRFRRAAR